MVRGIATKVVQINRIMQFALIFFCSNTLSSSVAVASFLCFAKIICYAFDKVVILPLLLFYLSALSS